MGSECVFSWKIVLQKDRTNQNRSHGVFTWSHGVFAWSLQGCSLKSQVCSELSAETLTVVVEWDSAL